MFLRKIKIQKKIGIVIAVIAIAAILVYLLINLQTYTKVRVSDTYVGEGAADNNYVQFLDGVLKYSKDGISYLNQSGKMEPVISDKESDDRCQRQVGSSS